MYEKWKKRRDEILAQMQSIVDNEERTDAHTQSLRQMEAEVALLNSQMEDYVRVTETRAAADVLDVRGARAGQQVANPASQANGRTLSIGEDFVASEQYRNYRGVGTSSVFEVEGLQERAPILTTTPDWDQAFFRPQRVEVADPSVSFPLFDVVSLESVSTGNVEYVTYGFDPIPTGGPEGAGNAAAVVPEGAPKPESTLAAVLTAAALDTIAHYVQTSRQALEDSARIRSIIDGELSRGVRFREHALLAAAIAAAVLPTAAGDDLLAAIRNGIGTVQGNGYSPNAVILNPADWAALDIGIMGSTLNGPVVRQSFWGLTPVADPSQAAGTATVGDFRSGVKHFRRNGVGIYISDSHASTFTSNIFTILGETRAKSAVVRPEALVDCAATPVIP